MKTTNCSILSLVLLIQSICSTTGFVAVVRQQQQHQLVSTITTTTTIPTSIATGTTKLYAKGFGSKPEKKEKSDGQKKREGEANKYDEISTAGGQEYLIYVRQFGSTDQSWLPGGLVAVPRGGQVSDAIYSNVDALKKAIVRRYPKLQGFETEFEFGFNLKIYPDDPIEVATRNKPRESGISVGNWISTLLSPIDTSGVQQPQSKSPPPN